MIGGRLLKTSSRFAIAAAAGILMSGYALSSAQAGGLGGDCCADLEERVAELEATTVRKGNRKVSLKLSGQVNRSLLWWDDGVEDNVYSVDNSNSSTRFRLTGSVGVLPGLSAGYKMEFDVETARSGSVDQADDDGGDEGDGSLEVRQANWWIKHDTLGKITLGQGSPATDDIVRINLGGTAVATKDGLIMDTGGNFFIRQGGGAGLTGARWSSLAPSLDTARRDIVRYDTPTIAGFTLSAAWGEDDFWDVGLRFAQEFAGIRLAGGIGYLEDHDEESDTAASGLSGSRDQQEYKGSISAWAPGLLGVGPYVSASLVHRQFDGNGPSDNGINGGNRPDFDFWRVEGGIRNNFTGLGDTTIYGEYAEAEGGLEDQDIESSALANDLSQSDVTMWGVGIVQRINPAAMELFVSYRSYEADLVDEVNGKITAEDLTLLHAGGRIKF